MSRCIASVYELTAVSGYNSPLQGRNTQSINEVCAMGVFRSQTARPLWWRSLRSRLFDWPSSLHAPHIVPDQQIPSLVDGHEPLQRVAADDGLAPDLEDGQLSPLHQLPHGVPPDAAALSGFLNRHAHFDSCHWCHAPFNVLILQPSLIYYNQSAIACQPILSPFYKTI